MHSTMSTRLIVTEATAESVRKRAVEMHPRTNRDTLRRTWAACRASLLARLGAVRVFDMPTRADWCPGAKISPTARYAPATAGSGRTAFAGSVGVACLNGVSSSHTGCHAGAEGSDGSGSGSITLTGSDRGASTSTVGASSKDGEAGGASTLALSSPTNRYPAAGGA